METVDGPIKGRFYLVDPLLKISLPSVTTILGYMTDKSYLGEWRKAVGEEVADKISTRGANRGTYMHSLLEQLMHFKFVIKTEKDLLKNIFAKAKEECPDFTEDEYRRGKQLFFNFYHSEFLKNVKEVLYQEVPVWSVKSFFAGRLDLCILNTEGQTVLIDFKSSTRPKTRTQIKNYKLQISAYSYGLYEQYKIWPHHCEIWISCESGELQKFVITGEEMKSNFIEFRNLSLKFKKRLECQEIE